MTHGNPAAFDVLKRDIKCGPGAARGHDHERIHLNKEEVPFKNKYTCVDASRLRTFASAEALNPAHLIGPVEVGKRADLLVFDANSVNLGGVEDPIVGMVFHTSSEDIEMVLVDGKIVKKVRKLVRDWAPVVKEFK